MAKAMRRAFTISTRWPAEEYPDVNTVSRNAKDISFPPRSELLFFPAMAREKPAESDSLIPAKVGVIIFPLGVSDSKMFAAFLRIEHQ